MGGNMAYQSGDDPQLIDDLRAALKRWHRPTLGDEPLAHQLHDVARRLVADRRLNRSEALRLTLRACLAGLRERDRGDEADLLERRYLRNQSTIRLSQTYHLSERTVYNRLAEAHVALAHALWALDGAATPSLPSGIARHLPPPSGHLFGVEETLARLMAYLSDDKDHWVVSLDGMAGLGKTALAREAAARLAETDHFAGIAWVTVRPIAFTTRGQVEVDRPALTCGQVLDTIADQLAGIDLAPLPLRVKRDRVHELLRPAAHLIVLDNLEAVTDCGALPQWLWEMADPAKFLLTSRHWLEVQVGQTVVSLDPLPESDARDLIRYEAEVRSLNQVAQAGDEILDRILAVTGGNPLAIKLAVGQLLSLPLLQVLAALEGARPDVDAFYDYLYCASWDLLSASAQGLLLRMAELPASGGTWDDLAVASGLAAGELATAIEELAAHSLLQVSGFEHKVYSLHVLTRYFVANQAALQNDAERQEPG